MVLEYLKHQDIVYELESRGFYFKDLCFWKKLDVNVSIRFVLQEEDMYLRIFDRDRNLLICDDYPCLDSVFRLIDLVENNVFIFNFINNSPNCIGFVDNILSDLHEYEIVTNSNANLFMKIEDGNCSLFSKLR
jgi:hypothetical protein